MGNNWRLCFKSMAFSGRVMFKDEILVDAKKIEVVQD